MGMCVEKQNEEFNKTRECRRNCRTHNAHSRRTKQTENQNRVSDTVGGNGNGRGINRVYGVSRLAQGGEVDIRETEGDKTDYRDHEVLFCEFQCQGDIALGRAVEEEEADELVIKDKEECDAGDGDNEVDDTLEACRSAYTFLVTRTVILGGENTGGARRAENDKVEDKNKLVDDRDGGECLGAK